MTKPKPKKTKPSKADTLGPRAPLPDVVFYLVASKGIVQVVSKPCYSQERDEWFKGRKFEAQKHFLAREVEDGVYLACYWIESDHPRECIAMMSVRPCFEEDWSCYEANQQYFMRAPVTHAESWTGTVKKTFLPNGEGDILLPHPTDLFSHLAVRESQPWRREPDGPVYLNPLQTLEAAERTFLKDCGWVEEDDSWRDPEDELYYPKNSALDRCHWAWHRKERLREEAEAKAKLCSHQTVPSCRIK